MVFESKENTSPDEMCRQLVEVYGARVMSRKRLRFYYTGFNKGRTDGNGMTHSVCVTQQLIEPFGCEQLNHPPYSPDLSPSDFHLFLQLSDS
ncbi:hypothetical protein AVEN_40160-1 [Araneus ventricosus]|uniref:Mos1 transposase HTH domain-containing protein n=2 Tax=Araneus ventricosus TaxID=182803 RepID=A0A4Y2W5R0_ARAVE|nr:hypothetical protein AVEN_40160-1 [Araneus ventricosus]